MAIGHGTTDSFVFVGLFRADGYIEWYLTAFVGFGNNN